MTVKGLMPMIGATFYHGCVPERRPTGPVSSHRVTPHRHITDKELRP